MKLLETVNFSGPIAKRRIYNCNNQNIFNCFFGIVDNTTSCLEFGNGYYTKISGDDSQPAFFTRKNKNLNYNNREYTAFYNTGSCVINSKVFHYNKNNSLMSESKVIYSNYINSKQWNGITTGTAYGTGKFLNPLYIGEYTGYHNYKILPNNKILYTNKYEFKNGQISKATYISQ